MMAVTSCNKTERDSRYRHPEDTTFSLVPARISWLVSFLRRRCVLILVKANSLIRRAISTSRYDRHVGARLARALETPIPIAQHVRLYPRKLAHFSKFLKEEFFGYGYGVMASCFNSLTLKSCLSFAGSRLAQEVESTIGAAASRSFLNRAMLLAGYSRVNTCI